MRGQRARAVALVVALCLFAGVVASGGAAPAAASIAPAALTNLTVGTVFTQAVTVTGPSPPYTVRVTQGVLPPALSLSPGGALRGTPRRSGSFAFTISAFTSDGTYVAFRDYVVIVARRSGGRTNRAYFADDFERGFGKWNLWGQSSAYTLVHGRAGQGASITVGPSTTGPTSSGSELASLWLDWPSAYAGAGHDTWYAAKVRFPTEYEPTSGQWNWFMEWHVDDATSLYPGAYSPGLGIFTD
jgi:hypothetical protein